jgi:hypothetical protein
MINRQIILKKGTVIATLNDEGTTLIQVSVLLGAGVIEYTDANEMLDACIESLQHAKIALKNEYPEKRR